MELYGSSKSGSYLITVPYDDSIEVWLDPTPGSEHGKTFQMVANSLGYKGYKMNPRGNTPEEPNWDGGWQVANGFHEGYWHCEVSVPLSSIAPNRSAFDGSWSINLCRNWKQPWAFSSLDGWGYAPENLRIRFVRDNAPVVIHENRSDIISGNINSVLILSNPTSKPIDIKTEMLLSRDMMPEVNQRESLSLKPDERKELTLQLSDTISRNFELKLNVTSSDGLVKYYDRLIQWKSAPPWEWKIEKQAQLPVDFQFAYYPYLNKMRILVNVTGLPENAALDYISTVIRQKDSKQVVKIVKFDQFRMNGALLITVPSDPVTG